MAFTFEDGLISRDKPHESVAQVVLQARELARESVRWPRVRAIARQTPFERQSAFDDLVLDHGQGLVRDERQGEAFDDSPVTLGLREVAIEPLPGLDTGLEVIDMVEEMAPLLSDIADPEPGLERIPPGLDGGEFIGILLGLPGEETLDTLALSDRDMTVEVTFEEAVDRQHGEVWIR